MKGLIVFLLTGILSFVAGLFYPWWSLTIVAFIISLIFRQKPVKSFFSAFLAIFLFWFGFSYFIDLANDHILAGRMSLLFLKTRSPVLMCVFSGLIGGLAGGLAALSASYLRKKKKKEPAFKLSYLQD